MEQKKKPDLNRISDGIVAIFCIVMSVVIVFNMVKDIRTTLKKKENKDGYSDTQTEAEITESETASQTDFEYDPSPELREYYEKIGTVLNIEKASESEKLYSETEIAEELQNRGFETDELIAIFSQDGGVIGLDPLDEYTDAKHPMYELTIRLENDEVWTISVVRDKIMVYPVSFMYSDDAIREPLISEESFFIGYDSESDAFFSVEPRKNNDEMLFIQIDKIDAESLQLLTQEKIAELQSAE